MSDDRDIYFAGLHLVIEPGWIELEDQTEESDGHGRLVFCKDESNSVLQFSIPPRRDGEFIIMDELRFWMNDMAKKAKLGRAFDTVEETGAHLVLASSFKVGSDFNRLWYWSNRKRLVLVTYGSNGPAIEDEVRESERMVARMRFEDSAPE